MRGGRSRGTTGAVLAVRWLLSIAGTDLGLDVVEGRGADDGEADEEDVGLGVGERSQPVVVFLSSSVPQAEADGLAINHDVRRVVVEAGGLARAAVEGCSWADSHSGDILAGEGICCVGDEETCLRGGSASSFGAEWQAERRDSLYQRHRHQSRRTINSQSAGTAGQDSRARTFRDWVAGAAIVY